MATYYFFPPLHRPILFVCVLLTTVVTSLGTALEDVLVDTKMPHNRKELDYTTGESFNSITSPTQSASTRVGRQLARQDHVRGSAESLVTKANASVIACTTTSTSTIVIAYIVRDA